MSRHATFENFGMAFLTLFQVSTGDNWNGIMKVQSYIQNIPYKAYGTQGNRQTSYNFLSICVLKGKTNTGLENNEEMVWEKQQTNSSFSLMHPTFHSIDAY